MRFKCNKKEECKFCAECCRFREKTDFNEKEESDIKRALFAKTGTLYLYPFSRYTINITAEEKKILEEVAKKKEIEINILPKKIFITDEGIIIYDYFIDADVCPFLTADNKCSIYEKRPLICRQFPNIGYDNSDFLSFKNSHNIIKVNYDKCLEYVKEKLVTSSR